MTVARQDELSGLGDLLAGAQIRGARPYQEDDYKVSALPDGDPDGCDFVMVLADGLGGHQGGAEASQVAVTTFVEAFESVAEGGVSARLREALDAANRAVGARADEDFLLWGMGCTLVGCVVTESEQAHWISVGDSPLWRMRTRADSDDAMLRLNADHSMKPVYAERVRRGEMTEEDARRGSNMLQSAVTGAEVPLVDEGTASLSAGDLLLLASDGLETLSDEDIWRRCGADADVAEVVRTLLQDVAARDSPSQDNATVLLYRHIRRGSAHR